jgi:hypothetical protein
MPSGGRRPGAGKKPGKHGTKAAYSLKLTPDVIAFLRETHPEGASGHVDATIRKQKAFKEWLAKRNKKLTEAAKREMRK